MGCEIGSGNIAHSERPLSLCIKTAVYNAPCYSVIDEVRFKLVNG